MKQMTSSFCFCFTSSSIQLCVGCIFFFTVVESSVKASLCMSSDEETNSWVWLFTQDNAMAELSVLSQLLVENSHN